MREFRSHLAIHTSVPLAVIAACILLSGCGATYYTRLFEAEGANRSVGALQIVPYVVAYIDDSSASPNFDNTFYAGVVVVPPGSQSGRDWDFYAPSLAVSIPQLTITLLPLGPVRVLTYDSRHDKFGTMGDGLIKGRYMIFDLLYIEDTVDSLRVIIPCEIRQPDSSVTRTTIEYTMIRKESKHWTPITWN